MSSFPVNISTNPALLLLLYILLAVGKSIRSIWTDPKTILRAIYRDL